MCDIKALNGLLCAECLRAGHIFGHHVLFMHDHLYKEHGGTSSIDECAIKTKAIVETLAALLVRPLYPSNNFLPVDEDEKAARDNAEAHPRHSLSNQTVEEKAPKTASSSLREQPTVGADSATSAVTEKEEEEKRGLSVQVKEDGSSMVNGLASAPHPTPTHNDDAAMPEDNDVIFVPVKSKKHVGGAGSGGAADKVKREATEEAPPAQNTYLASAIGQIKLEMSKSEEARDELIANYGPLLRVEVPTGDAHLSGGHVSFNGPATAAANVRCDQVFAGAGAGTRQPKPEPADGADDTASANTGSNQSAMAQLRHSDAAAVRGRRGDGDVCTGVEQPAPPAKRPKMEPISPLALANLTSTHMATENDRFGWAANVPQQNGGYDQHQQLSESVYLGLAGVDNASATAPPPPHLYAQPLTATAEPSKRHTDSGADRDAKKRAELSSRSRSRNRKMDTAGAGASAAVARAPMVLLCSVAAAELLPNDAEPATRLHNDHSTDRSAHVSSRLRRSSRSRSASATRNGEGRDREGGVVGDWWKDKTDRRCQ